MKILILVILFIINVCVIFYLAKSVIYKQYILRQRKYIGNLTFSYSAWDFVIKKLILNILLSKWEKQNVPIIIFLMTGLE